MGDIKAENMGQGEKGYFSDVNGLSFRGITLCNTH